MLLVTARSCCSACLEHRERRLELDRRLGDRQHLHLSAAIEHMVEDLHGVDMLLAGLRAHPGGESGQVLVLEVGRHREVGERTSRTRSGSARSARPASWD